MIMKNALDMIITKYDFIKNKALAFVFTLVINSIKYRELSD